MKCGSVWKCGQRGRRHGTPPTLPHLHTSTRRIRGYTLAETLVAMVIFALITAATSFALNTAIRGQRAAQQRAEDLQEARTLLGIISKDLRSSYASAGNTNTFFLATGTDMSTLLTFTALNHRIELQPESGDSQPFDPEAESQPQSDVSVIRYSFNPETGEFSRCVSPVPNPDTLPEPGLPSTVLSRRVRSVELEFLDGEAGPRTEWNFFTDPESLSPQAPAGGSGAQGSAQSDTSPASEGDTTLPSAVQVRLILEGQNRRPYAYQTMVTLASPEPQPIGQKPPAPAQNPQAGSGGGGGGGQGGGGQGGGGGGQGGGGQGGGGQGGPGGGLPGLPGMPGAGGSRP